MSSIPSIKPSILAPFVVEYDEETSDFKAEIAAGVMAHLRNPNFYEEVDVEKTPGITKFSIIRSHANLDNQELSTEKMVEREFANSGWDSQVQSLLKLKGLTEENRFDTPDAPTYSRFSRDDNYYTVRLDNLPDNDGRDEINYTLRDLGCNYFDRVIVPYDDVSGTHKHFCFIKFVHLRYAIKFIEEFRHIRMGTMLLNAQLAS